MILAAALLGALSTATAPPRLMVEVSKEQIRVESHAVPLITILEELASRLDVRLVIDGPSPTVPVTAAVQGPHLASVLTQLLEPRRMRYATSARGTRVHALVVVTKSEVRPSAPATPSPTPEPTSQPFANSAPEPVLPDHPSPPDEP
jgi:hypothetical protein